MELLLAGYIVYLFFQMLGNIWKNLAEMRDEYGNLIYKDEHGRLVYRTGEPVPSPGSKGQETKGREQKRTKSGQKYTVTDPDIDGCTVYNLDGGDLDDDDDLVYPE